MGKSGGLAVFVKTPGVSAVKTRLAESIGAEQASAFYRLSVAATEAVVRVAAENHGGVQPYWAVYEDDPSALAKWTSFPVIKQGSGGLGERLHRVYDELLKKHRFAVLTGADLPHLAPVELERAITQTELLPTSFILGRTEDGGFYAFGGAIKLPRKMWMAVPYGQENTADELAEHLQANGDVVELDLTFDVDTAEDLTTLKEQLEETDGLLPEQQALLDWLKQLPKV